MENTYKEIQLLLKRWTNVVSIEANMSLQNDLGLSSLDLVQLATEVYNQFGIDLGEALEEGHKINNVGDLLQIIGTYKK